MILVTVDEQGDFAVHSDNNTDIAVWDMTQKTPRLRLTLALAIPPAARLIEEIVHADDGASDTIIVYLDNMKYQWDRSTGIIAAVPIT